MREWPVCAMRRRSVEGTARDIGILRHRLLRHTEHNQRSEAFDWFSLVTASSCTGLGREFCPAFTTSSNNRTVIRQVGRVFW